MVWWGTHWRGPLPLHPPGSSGEGGCEDGREGRREGGMGECVCVLLHTIRVAVLCPPWYALCERGGACFTFVYVSLGGVVKNQKKIAL